jgi:branched-chain amino acid transport system substrate-binding protein
MISGRGLPRVFAGACTIVVVASLAGCDQKPGGGTTSAPAGGAGSAAVGASSQAGAAPSGISNTNDTGSGPILVGHYASLTGNEATWGVSTDNGVKLAVKEQNAAGGIKGRQIKLITYDNQGRQQESATAVTRLITQDKVCAVLGEVASSRSMAAGQVCQRYGVPMISPSSTNPRVTEIGDMIFRVCFIDPFQGYVCAKFARGEPLKAQRACTLYNRSQAYSAGLNETFKQHFAAMGGKIVGEQAYGDGDADYSAQLTTIRDAKPDVIFIPGYYTEVINIAVQARRLGITQPLLGGDGWDAEDLKNAGTALDGCFYSNHYSEQETRPAVQEFVQRYKAEFGSIPDGMAATGYDSAKMLFDGMQRAKSLSGRDLAAALAATEDLALVTGVITMDAHRDARKPAVILRLQGGKPYYLTTIEPAGE